MQLLTRHSEQGKYYLYILIIFELKQTDWAQNRGGVGGVGVSNKKMTS